MGDTNQLIKTVGPNLSPNPGQDILKKAPTTENRAVSLPPSDAQNQVIVTRDLQTVSVPSGYRALILEKKNSNWEISPPEQPLTSENTEDWLIIVVPLEKSSQFTNDGSLLKRLIFALKNNQIAKINTSLELKQRITDLYPDVQPLIFVIKDDLTTTESITIETDASVKRKNKKTKHISFTKLSPEEIEKEADDKAYNHIFRKDDRFENIYYYFHALKNQERVQRAMANFLSKAKQENHENMLALLHRYNLLFGTCSETSQAYREAAVYVNDHPHKTILEEDYTFLSCLLKTNNTLLTITRNELKKEQTDLSAQFDDYTNTKGPVFIDEDIPRGIDETKGRVKAKKVLTSLYGHTETLLQEVESLQCDANLINDCLVFNGDNPTGILNQILNHIDALPYDQKERKMRILINTLLNSDQCCQSLAHALYDCFPKFILPEIKAKLLSRLNVVAKSRSTKKIKTRLKNNPAFDYLVALALLNTIPDDAENTPKKARLAYELAFKENRAGNREFFTFYYADLIKTHIENRYQKQTNFGIFKAFIRNVITEIEDKPVALQNLIVNTLLQTCLLNKNYEYAAYLYQEIRKTANEMEVDDSFSMLIQHHIEELSKTESILDIAKSLRHHCPTETYKAIVEQELFFFCLEHKQYTNAVKLGFTIADLEKYDISNTWIQQQLLFESIAPLFESKDSTAFKTLAESLYETHPSRLIEPTLLQICLNHEQYTCAVNLGFTMANLEQYHINADQQQRAKFSAAYEWNIQTNAGQATATITTATLVTTSTDDSCLSLLEPDSTGEDDTRFSLSNAKSIASQTSDTTPAPLDAYTKELVNTVISYIILCERTKPPTTTTTLFRAQPEKPLNVRIKDIINNLIQLLFPNQASNIHSEANNILLGFLPRRMRDEFYTKNNSVNLNINSSQLKGIIQTVMNARGVSLPATLTTPTAASECSLPQFCA